ncbi:MAG: hypothetical protein M3O71_15015 [Bacteroidota bacterium]|nr:hypothetical protein [Bacteroidota bacterium]
MNFIKIYKIGSLVILSLVLLSFQQANSLKGTWEYCGDVFNGKTEGAPVEYSLQRKYTKTNFESFLLEKGQKAEKYEAGDYTINADTCLETQTFSLQESKLVGITIHYAYSIRNDTLILTGTLPSGGVTKEFWKKVK